MPLDSGHQGATGHLSSLLRSLCLVFDDPGRPLFILAGIVKDDADLLRLPMIRVAGVHVCVPQYNNTRSVSFRVPCPPA